MKPILKYGAAALAIGFVATLAPCGEAEHPKPEMIGPVQVRKIVNHDLPEIVKEQKLRLVTRNNATNYFLFKGAQLGFEYQLVEKFAEKNSLHVEVITATSWKQMVDMLDNGEADLIGAGYTPSPERERQVDFTIPYREIDHVLVASEKSDVAPRWEELEGRTVHIRKNSPAADAVKQMKAMQDVHINIEFLSESLETEEVLQQVAQGDINVTVADRALAQMEQVAVEGLQIGSPVGSPASAAFALRPNAPQLKAVLNDFLAKIEKRKWFAVVKRRYFEDRGRLARQRSHSSFTLSSGRLSPWDDFFRHYGEGYGFDWRLIAAVAWRESNFNPNSKSWVGAKGIMQIMPIAAKDLGMDCFSSNDANIHCGVRFLSKLRAQFKHIDEDESLKFALAAFNAGMGHVRDARVLCLDYGLNPMVWDDNVEEAMLLLMRRHYYKQYRSGYCNGRQAVDYVREIMTLYKTYKQNVPLNPDETEPATAVGQNHP